MSNKSQYGEVKDDYHKKIMAKSIAKKLAKTLNSCLSEGEDNG